MDQSSREADLRKAFEKGYEEGYGQVARRAEKKREVVEALQQLKKSLVECRRAMATTPSPIEAERVLFCLQLMSGGVEELQKTVQTEL